MCFQNKNQFGAALSSVTLVVNRFFVQLNKIMLLVMKIMAVLKLLVFIKLTDSLNGGIVI